MAGERRTAPPPPVVRLRIVVGYYGMPWNPYHGAWGGKSIETEQEAEQWAAEVRQGSRTRVHQGLWPGPTPMRMVDISLEAFATGKGLLIALCEPITAF